MLKPKIIKPRAALNALLSKKTILKGDLGRFKTALDKLLSLNTKESEEHQKNELKEFLAHAYGYNINTKGRIDYAIFKDKAPVVIIEAKKLDNKTEMISQNEIGRKSLFEAILYFMGERKEGNDRLAHIIIATAFEWFLFDAKDFERLFWQNKDFKKRFLDWSGGKLLHSDTPYFYDEIAKPFVQAMMGDLVNDEEIECVYFDLRKVGNESEQNALFKLLSPDYLLKEFNPNDANTLNREFYSELLHILGLEEIKEGGKKTIKESATPNTILKNARNKLSQYNKPSDFESILGLIILWSNRILFLKLLESQIYRYNGNDSSFKFLSFDKISQFDDLESLFFDTLAKRPRDRTNKSFDYVPYLNSSLFEIAPEEKELITVSNLFDNAEMPYYAKTILKDKNQKQSGSVNPLKYLFDFLDAYDFASEGDEEVREDKKELINASVLGLIFEKINGYKDGGFYTPGFITSYMAKEAIEKAILQKFLDAKGWECADLTALYNKLDNTAEARGLIDSITICDPAVGSGHFLVSCLNELLYAKSYLGLLVDDKGKNLGRSFAFSAQNDEFFAVDKESGEIVEYRRPKVADDERHILQKTLFEQKRHIIENQLFGVDINPNSVNICRLRLWIELLKNAYYTDESAYKELQTLPNIDINIKCGNSLISRYALEGEIKINNIKAEVKAYKKAVGDYKETNIKELKADVALSLDRLKDRFALTLKASGKTMEQLKAKLKEYASEYGYDGLADDLTLIALKNNYKQSGNLFGEKPDEKKRTKLLNELNAAQAKIEEIESGKIYQNAFEWRFEFPEVLDEKGDFKGFDVVIGNPPYIPLSKLDADYSTFGYEVFDRTGDIFALFFEKSVGLLRSGGRLGFIVSNGWLRTKYGEPLKRFFAAKTADRQIVNFEDVQIFDEATVESCIVGLTKASGGADERLVTVKKPFDPKTATVEILSAFVSDSGDSDEVSALMRRIEGVGKPLKEWEVSIYRGVLTGFNEAFIIDNAKKEELIAKDAKSAELLKPLLRGRDVQKYATNYAGLWLINSHNNPPVKIEEYPAIKAHLDGYYDKLVKRQDKGKTPYNLRNCAYLADFEKPKIVWGEISDEPKFAFEDGNFYAEATNFILTGEKLKYLIAVLNSKFSKWYFQQISTTTGMGTNRWKKFKLELLPIAVPKDEKPFIDLVDKILELKKNGGDTSELEKEIDTMVYELYGLTEDEIKTVEGAK